MLRPNNLPSALFAFVSMAFVALSSCSPQRVCQVEGKTKAFDVSSLSIDEYVRKYHSSFAEIGGDKKLSVVLPEAKDGSTYHLYISGSRTLAMTHEATVSESFETKSYHHGDEGRRYLVVAYQEGTRHSYAGYAFGWPEEDPSVLESLKSTNTDSIRVKRYRWETDSYREISDYDIKDKDKIASFHSAFEESVLIRLDLNFHEQVPGITRKPSYYAVTFGDDEDVTFTLDENDRMTYQHQRYGVLDASFASWLRSVVL